MNLPSEMQLDVLSHQKLGSWMRERILSGELATGTRLPSMQQLAENWNTSYFTVHSALTPLVREGLLERRRKYGTVVCRPTPAVTCVGIYYGMDVWASRTTAFYQALHAELKKLLGEQGLEFRLLLDSRDEVLQDKPLPELQEKVQGREIQALIVPVATAAEKKWLRKLPVPLVDSSRNSSTGTEYESREAVRQAMSRLYERGVRKIGVIGSVPRNPTKIVVPPGEVHHYTKFYQFVEEIIAELGMTMHESWLKIPQIELEVEEVEEFGYRSFQEIWKLPEEERPESLFCRTDVLSRGVVMGVLEQQAHLNNRVQLILEKNEEVGFFCPFPADWIVYKVRDLAEAMVEQIRRQAAKEEISNIAVPACYESDLKD